MKRYLLFTFPTYVPAGGWNDFHSQHDCLSEALMAAAKREHSMNHFQIVDTQSAQIVADDITGIIKKENP